MHTRVRQGGGCGCFFVALSAQEVHRMVHTLCGHVNRVIVCESLIDLRNKIRAQLTSSCWWTPGQQSFYLRQTQVTVHTVREPI